jgi:hypothetical protein
MMPEDELKTEAPQGADVVAREVDPDELAQEVRRVGSACVLLEWVFESFIANPPATEKMHMEVLEGLIFVSGALAARLDEIGEKLLV